MRRSTEQEVQEVTDLVLSTRARIDELLQNGKKVHIIWDFDGVLASRRDHDVYECTGIDLKTYFAYEERLTLESPERGPWLLLIAHNTGAYPHFPSERFTQDIVTTRSSTLAIRVYIFCFAYHLPIRWMLFGGHQPKNEAYRIILKSLKNDRDYYVFCIDDDAKYIKAFQDVSAEEGMIDRTFGVVSPVIRTYTEEELKEYYDKVMGAAGNTAIRVRNPSDDTKGFIVLPDGLQQFRKYINTIVSKKSAEGHAAELRSAFVKAYGEVGSGHFKTEKELKRAMNEFILGLHCP